MMAKVEQSIEVNVPVHAAYDQLIRFEQYPSFMEDVEEVRQIDDTHLHWHTRAGNLDMEWDAEITQQVPDRCIAWRNLSGPRYQGRIDLQQTEGERTRLTLSMDCDPRQQLLAQHGNADAMLAERTRHDLARFKKFIEKLARDNGQWRGRPSELRPRPVSSEAQAAGSEMGKTVGRSAGEAREAETGGSREAAAEATTAASSTASTTSATSAANGNWMLRPPWLPGLLQAWEQPMGVMRKMSDDMDSMFGRLLARPMEGLRLHSDSGGRWTPAVDIAQRDDCVTVTVELAGVRREDVSVEIRTDHLTIEGERRQPDASHPQQYRRSERAYGRFRREVALPVGADADAASATMRDGVLEITVPFAQTARQGRRLEIRRGRDSGD